MRTLRQRAEDRERETGKTGWLLRQARKAEERQRVETHPWLSDFTLADGELLAADGLPVDLRDAVARVETVGELRRRVTATRLAATGVLALALKKRDDSRAVIVTIEGPRVALVREYPTKRLDRAALAQFVAEVNQVAQRHA